MESLRDVKRTMEREVEKGKITPLQLERMEVTTDDYKQITSKEQFKKVINWLLRLSEYRTGEATVSNNVYMKPTRRKPEFIRTKSILERMQLFHEIARYETKLHPDYEGDVYLESTRCYFSVPEEWLAKCRMNYKGEDTYGFLFSNKYILGLFTMCMSQRTQLAIDYEIRDMNSDIEHLIMLDQIKEVLFSCLILDDIKIEKNLVVANLYTIYIIE